MFEVYTENVYISGWTVLGTPSSHKGWTSLELSANDAFRRLWLLRIN